MKTLFSVSLLFAGIQSYAQPVVNSFYADPNPIRVAAGETLGVTNINWNVSGVSEVEVRVISPTGPLFAAGGGVGQATTGKWVIDGMKIYLVNRSNGATLSVITVAIVPDAVPSFSRDIIVAPNVADPTGLFLVDHVGTPLDKFFMRARYQRPNPLDAASSPVRHNNSYSAHLNTGIGPFTSFYQRGPIGGSVPQSSYQIKGTEVGVLMRSWDSPHPSRLPTCQPNCAGYQKHTIYEYRGSSGKPIFTSNDPGRSLLIEGEFQALQFEQWSIFTGGAPLGVVAGQYALVLFLEDPSGKQIQYVIFVYDSNPNTGSAYEGLFLEIIGAGTNGYFVNSSTKKARTMTYTTVDASAPYEFSNNTWSGFRPMKVKITQENLANVIRDLNLRGGTLSTDVLGYKVRGFGINTEIYSEDNGDAWVMGTSTRNLKVREVGP